MRPPGPNRKRCSGPGSGFCSPPAWPAGSWPVEWGGRGLHQLHDIVVTEELIGVRAPRPLEQVQLATHVLLRFGTQAQKSRYLPQIRSGRHIWCQLFSEPDAGSDLAALRCRAVPVEGGRFVVNGQKTWTSDAHWADMGLALFRTGSTGERRQTVTAFLVPMGLPGVTVRPILNLGGVHEFNDVLFDDVELGADAVVGSVGGGWEVALSGLDLERLTIGSNVALVQRLTEDVAELAAWLVVDGKPAWERDDVMEAIVTLAAEAEAAASFVVGYVEKSMAGTAEPGDAELAKMLYSEAYNRIARFGVLLVAEHGVPDHEQGQLAARRLEDAWLFSRALTIAGGSSEIMRNIVARRRLLLPLR